MTYSRVGKAAIVSDVVKLQAGLWFHAFNKDNAVTAYGHVTQMLQDGAAMVRLTSFDGKHTNMNTRFTAEEMSTWRFFRSRKMMSKVHEKQLREDKEFRKKRAEW